MGTGTGQRLGNQRGVNKRIRDLYNAADRGDKARIARLHAQGITTPARMNKALAALNARNAPRRESRARTAANRAQLAFDRDLAANPRGAARIRRNAPEGVDLRRGPAGLRAARSNVVAANEAAARRQARREAAAAAAAAAQAAAAGRRRRRTPRA